MALLVVSGAGRDQLLEVGEVVVDGEAGDAGLARDLGHGRVRHALLFVQGGGGAGDLLASLALLLGARLQLVFLGFG